MKFDWQNWDMGGRIIFVAACAAIVSMFMDWVSIGIISQSGLTQGTFLILGFWVYPILMLLKGDSIHRLWGLICSIGSCVATIAYIGSKSIEIFGKTVNAAATGSWLFLLASFALIFGVMKYQVRTSMIQDSNSTSEKFCTECGAKSASKTAFCNECGAKIK